MLIRGLGAGLLFVLMLVYARGLGTKLFGIFSLAFTMFSIASVVLRVGLDTVVLKNASANLLEKPMLAIGYLRSSLKFVAVIGISAAAVIYMSSEFVAEKVFRLGELSEAIRMFSFGLVPMSMLILLVEFMKAKRRPSTSAFFQSLSIPAFALIFVPVFAFSGYSGLEEIIGTYVLAVLLSMIIASLLLRHDVLHKAREKVPWKALLEQGMPMLLVSSGAMVMSWTDIIILGFFSSPEEVGIYTASARTVMLLSLILMAINAITAPRYAKLYADSKLKEMELVVKNVSLVLILFVTLPGLTIFIFAGDLMGLFGVEYRKGQSYLMILAIGQLVNVICGSVAYLLSMTGHEKKLRNIFLMTALFNIFLSLLLVQQYGEIGVAFATMISTVIWNLWAMLEVRKRLGFWTISLSINKGKTT